MMLSRIHLSRLVPHYSLRSHCLPAINTWLRCTSSAGVEKPSMLREFAPDLPLLDKEMVLQALDAHSKQRNSSSILAITGRKDVGKTFAIQESLSKLRSAEASASTPKRIFLDYDLKGMQGGYAEFVGELHFHVTKAIGAMNPRVPDHEQQELLSRHQLGSKENLLKKARKEASWWADKLKRLGPQAVGVVGAVGELAKPFDPSGGALVKLVEVAFDLFRVSGSSLSLASSQQATWFLLKTLDLAARYSDTVPTLLLRDFQSLKFSDGDTAIYHDKLLAGLVEAVKQRSFSFPIVLELSDYIYVASVVRGSAGVTEVEVPLLTEEQARAAVGKQLFEAREFDEVWRAVGGVSGHMLELYGQLKMGIALETALARFTAARSKAVRIAMHKLTPADFPEGVRILKEIADTGRSPCKGPVLFSESVPQKLVRANVLYYEEDTDGPKGMGSLVAQNPAIKHAIGLWVAESRERINEVLAEAKQRPQLPAAATAAPPKPLDPKVKQWLDANGFGEYETKFAGGKVDWVGLPLLNAKLLVDIFQVAPMDAIKIEAAIKASDFSAK